MYVYFGPVLMFGLGLFCGYIGASAIKTGEVPSRGRTVTGLPAKLIGVTYILMSGFFFVAASYSIDYVPEPCGS